MKAGAHDVLAQRLPCFLVVDVGSALDGKAGLSPAKQFACEVGVQLGTVLGVERYPPQEVARHPGSQRYSSLIGAPPFDEAVVTLILQDGVRSIHMNKSGTDGFLKEP